MAKTQQELFEEKRGQIEIGPELAAKIDQLSEETFVISTVVWDPESAETLAGRPERRVTVEIRSHDGSDYRSSDTFPVVAVIKGTLEYPN